MATVSVTAGRVSVPLAVAEAFTVVVPEEDPLNTAPVAPMFKPLLKVFVPVKVLLADKEAPAPPGAGPICACATVADKKNPHTRVSNTLIISSTPHRAVWTPPMKYSLALRSECQPYPFPN